MSGKEKPARIRLPLEKAEHVTKIIKILGKLDPELQILKGNGDSCQINFSRLSEALDIYPKNSRVQKFDRTYLSGLLRYDPRFKGVTSEYYLKDLIQTITSLIRTRQAEIAFCSTRRHRAYREDLDLFLETAEKILNSPQILKEWYEAVDPNRPDNF